MIGEQAPDPVIDDAGDLRLNNDANENEKEPSEFIDVNYYIAQLGSEHVKTGQILNKVFGRPYKLKLSTLLAEFLKFICVKVAEKPYKFDLGSKMPVKEFNSNRKMLLISIKDPFIPR